MIIRLTRAMRSNGFSPITGRISSKSCHRPLIDKLIQKTFSQRRNTRRRTVLPNVSIANSSLAYETSSLITLTRGISTLVNWTRPTIRRYTVPLGFISFDLIISGLRDRHSWSVSLIQPEPWSKGSNENDFLRNFWIYSCKKMAPGIWEPICWRIVPVKLSVLVL